MISIYHTTFFPLFCVTPLFKRKYKAFTCTMPSFPISCELKWIIPSINLRQVLLIDQYQTWTMTITLITKCIIFESIPTATIEEFEPIFGRIQMITSISSFDPIDDDLGE